MPDEQENVAFVFPGQGSQYVGMLRDLACQFPAMQQALAEADAAFAVRPDGQRLSDLIYPHPAFMPDGHARTFGEMTSISREMRAQLEQQLASDPQLQRELAIATCRHSGFRILVG